MGTVTVNGFFLILQVWSLKKIDQTDDERNAAGNRLSPYSLEESGMR